jgi:hypothetical protein
MQDELINALVARLEPTLHMIGLMVVLGILTFGSTIFSIWYKSKDKKAENMASNLNANTIAIAKIEAKLDLFISQSNKDFRNLGDKIRSLKS